MGAGADPITSAVGLGVGIIGSIGKLFGNAKSNRELKKLQSADPTYSQNPIAGQRLSLAQTLLNARSPGAAIAERNIYANQGNQMGNISRNATDSSQALALGAANIGQSNQAFNQLGQQEANDYQRRYQNLSNAQEGMINEGDKVYGDQVRRFGDKAQIQGAINANRQNTWTSIQNLGGGVADFGMNGGMSSLFGGGGGGGGSMGGGGGGGSSWGNPTQWINGSGI